MSPRVARVISRGIVVACIGVIVVDVSLLTALQRRGPQTEVFIVGHPDAPGMAEVRADLEERLSRGEVSGESPLAAMGFGALALVWAIVGSLIVSRQPRNVAGWILNLVGASIPVNGFAFAYVLYGVKVAHAALPGLGLAAILGEYSFASFALIPLLFLLFPDGHPPSPRWAWATRLLVAGFILAFGAFALQPGPLNNLVDSGILYENPFGIAAFADGEPGSLLIPIGALTVLLTTLATVVAVRQRFRRAVGEERQQMRWLVAVATLAGSGLALLLLLEPVAALLRFGDERAGPPIFEILLIATALTVFLGIPGAYLVSIFRYRLWELDVVIRKTVIAVVLTGLLASLGLIIIGVAGQVAVWEETNRAVTVLVGVLAGSLIWPLLRLSRRISDRLTFGRRATSYEVLTAFSERVGEAYSTADVLPRMVRVLASGIGASSARVLLHVGTEVHEMARWPEDGMPTPGEHVVPVMDLGEELGALAVSMPPSDPMDPAKEKLIRDLASQAGLVLRTVKLIEDLRASRQRLVAALDEERRRIERNIHDGAQQQLVALRVKIGLAERLARRNPEKTMALLAELGTEAANALDDLRDLARGIYPPLLADEGLTAALEAQARKAVVPVSVETDGVGRYPQEVEAAVYFCALEALNNVAKYSEASRVEVRLEHSGDALVFEVQDDGIGFEITSGQRGTGLQGMADRLEAIGGRLDVRSSPGVGTTIVGVVPIRSR